MKVRRTSTEGGEDVDCRMKLLPEIERKSGWGVQIVKEIMQKVKSFN